MLVGMVVVMRSKKVSERFIHWWLLPITSRVFSWFLRSREGWDGVGFSEMLVVRVLRGGGGGGGESVWMGLAKGIDVGGEYMFYMVDWCSLVVELSFCLIAAPSRHNPALSWVSRGAAARLE